MPYRLDKSTWLAIRGFEEVEIRFKFTRNVVFSSREYFSHEDFYVLTKPQEYCMNQPINSRTFFNPIISPEKTAQNISALINSSNLTVCDLQNLFGFDSPQAIYNWKEGNSLPALDNLVKLSHFLHTPIDKIIVVEMRQNNAKHDIPEKFRIGG